jgi:hypothetical protein
VKPLLIEPVEHLAARLLTSSAARLVGFLLDIVAAAATAARARLHERRARP